jgi:uncharacterized protein (DUF58 family)
MLPEELLKKVKQIEISTKKMMTEVMTGRYRSHFKGAGVQFSEHRVYLPGDDVRHIDWKVSARSREPLIKKYEEERELTVFLVADVSGSGEFGTQVKSKAQVLAEVGGMLAYAASQGQDRVGAVFFTEKVEHLLPPKKGNQHVLRIIRDLLGFKPIHRGTQLGEALEKSSRLMKHSSIVFILSDFLAPVETYELELRKLAQKHDVVSVWIQDLREEIFPDTGLLLLKDAESGEESWIDTGSYPFKVWYEENIKKQREKIQNLMQKSHVDLLEIRTHEDYAEALVRFFKTRSRRRR